MSIKNRFYLLIVLVVVAMLILLGLSRYNASQIIQLEQEEVLLVEIEAGILQLRRNEKDFLSRKNLKYLGKFNKNHEAVIADVRDLSQRLEASDIDATKSYQMAEVLQTYGDKFRSLVKIQQQIGLHPKDGLYGSLRAAVHGVEDLVKNSEDYHLLNDMLMLRRNEKDFMLRDDLKYLGKFDNNITKFEATLVASAIPSSMKDEIATKLDKYRTYFHALVEGYKRKGLTSKEGLSGQMRKTVHHSDEIIVQMHAGIITAVEELIRQSNLFMLVSGLLLTGVLAAILLWLSQVILKPVLSFADTMHHATKERNLALRAGVGSKCEIGAMANAFNGMMSEFQELLIQVSGSSGQVGEASHHLAEVTESTMTGVQQQHEESDQVATAMNEMATTVQEVARYAVKAADASTKADTEAENGAQVVKQSMEGIQHLAQEVENTSTAINELEQESNNIGTVLSVITGIAEQTNLLALNAAIEAARAGEQGRGFAVVADEVRTLAQRSQESTEEIKAIIERLQSKAQVAVYAMEVGRSQAQVSVDQAQQAGVSLQAISEAIGSIRDMNTHIATAAEEQSAVAEEINCSIVQIAQAAERGAEGAEQTAQTSDKLANLSSQLQDRVNTFTLS
ncbi:MAG: methyl-accepting chemotaxis protein [Gammaproteobacteria bacterium]|nr:methyl-accepting chemotaxis protein [Gammaproteobacteria bacterium]